MVLLFREAVIASLFMRPYYVTGLLEDKINNKYIRCLAVSYILNSLHIIYGCMHIVYSYFLQSGQMT